MVHLICHSALQDVYLVSYCCLCHIPLILTFLTFSADMWYDTHCASPEKLGMYKLDLTSCLFNINLNKSGANSGGFLGINKMLFFLFNFKICSKEFEEEIKNIFLLSIKIYLLLSVFIITLEIGELPHIPNFKNLQFSYEGDAR